MAGGSARPAPGALALVVAARGGWEAAYLACAALALPAMLTALVMGEPKRHREPAERKGVAGTVAAVWRPFVEFFERKGAFLVLLFILLHKIGDTLANLTFRLLFDDLGFTNDEIAIYDVGVGFWAYLIGIFIGGILYAQLGMKRSVLISLILMAVSNFSFALLAMAGTAIGAWPARSASRISPAASAACASSLTSRRCATCASPPRNMRLISAAASIVGRFLTGTTAGALIEAMGYVNFYLLTTLAALPGIVLFWWMMRGADRRSIGTPARSGERRRRAEHPKRGEARSVGT
jgi:PAT family beta-lactamase induction signal transducer AmpG